VGDYIFVFFAFLVLLLIFTVIYFAFYLIVLRSQTFDISCIEFTKDSEGFWIQNRNSERRFIAYAHIKNVHYEFYPYRTAGWYFSGFRLPNYSLELSRHFLFHIKNAAGEEMEFRIPFDISNIYTALDIICLKIAKERLGNVRILNGKVFASMDNQSNLFGSKINLDTRHGKFFLVTFAMAVLFFWVFMVFNITDSLPNRKPGQEIQEILPTSKASEAGNAKTIKSGHFISNIENLKLEIPNNWHEVKVKDVIIPNGFKEPLFVFKKDSSDCTLAYTSHSQDSEGIFKEVSFADRIFSRDWQFDGKWYIPYDSADKTINFSDDNRQYLENEFRTSNVFYRSPNFFLLFNNGSNKPIPDTCNMEVNSTLKTVEYYYNPVSLTKYSEGVLWVTREFSKQKERTLARIVFTPHNDVETYEIIILPEGLSQSGKFSVYGNKLYYPVNKYTANANNASRENAIGFIDIFSKEIGEFSSTKTLGGYISSIYLQDEEIYYLLGDGQLGFCLDSSRECRADLYKVNISSGKQVLLGKNVLGGSIKGYSEEEGAFYLSNEWGDAGCATYMFSRFRNGTEEIIGRYSGCIDESELTFAKNVSELVNEKISGEKITTRHAYVKNGIILPYQDTEQGGVMGRAKYKSFSFDLF